MVRGSHWVLLTSKTGAVWRRLAQQKARPPIVSFVATELKFNQWKELYRTEVFSCHGYWFRPIFFNYCVYLAFPCPCCLSTKRQRAVTGALAQESLPDASGTHLRSRRRPRILETGDYVNRSKSPLEYLSGQPSDWPIFHLQSMFPAFEVTNIEQVNLSANRQAESERVAIKDGLVTLNPMEIRTLLLTFKRKNDGKWKDRLCFLCFLSYNLSKEKNIPTLFFNYSDRGPARSEINR